MRNSKPDSYLVSAAGVYFVAAELSRRGLFVLPTMRNARGIDIMVTNADRTWHANLKVRMQNSGASSWSMASMFRGTVDRKDWYAFVRYVKDESRFEVFLESAKRVHKQVFQNHGYMRLWRLPNSHVELERVRRQWREFGLAKTS
jgi:hypothetical protein